MEMKIKREQNEFSKKNKNNKIKQQKGNKTI